MERAHAGEAVSTAPPTRKRTRQETPPASEITTLATILGELREMREDHARREAELVARMQRQEEELLQLRTATTPQLSTHIDRASANASPRRACGEESRSRRVGAEESEGRVSLGFKLKPDTYDGSAPLGEFLTQFDLIARANAWDDATKTVALASSLRGKARAVLETVPDVATLKVVELKQKLELRFGEGRFLQNFYTQFTNRKQRFGEDLAALGSDLERLARLAYPECPYEVRDKIACAQFVSAVYDGFTRRTLQLENVTSLNVAIERAKAITVIRGNGGERREFSNGFSKNSKDASSRKENGGARKRANGEKEEKGPTEGRRASKPNAGKRECWTCGKAGHFRADCPEAKGN